MYLFAKGVDLPESISYTIPVISLWFGCDIFFYICLFLLFLLLFGFFFTGSVYVYSLQHYVINL
jgi:hypothetical protein